LVAKAPAMAKANAATDSPIFLKFMISNFSVQIHAYYFLQVFGFSCSIAIEMILILCNGIGIQCAVIQRKQLTAFHNKVRNAFLSIKWNV
jgi:hypothetical protein